MSSSSPLEITRLELTIDRLVFNYQELLHENRRLQQEIQQMKQRQAILIDKSQRAAVHVKQVIHQLREATHERST